MTIIPINVDSTTKYQAIETSLTIEKKTFNVRIELRFLNKTNRWYLSMFDRKTGDPFFLYVPVVSYVTSINNLVAPFEYKGIGFIVCATLVDETSSEDPQRDNLHEFGIAWGDGYV